MNEEEENLLDQNGAEGYFVRSLREAKTRILINKIQNKNYEPFKSWNEQNSGGSKTYLKEQIRSLLEIVSGLEVTALVKDLLNDMEKEKIQEKELLALKNIGELYSSQNGRYFKPKIKRTLVKQLKL